MPQEKPRKQTSYDWVAPEHFGAAQFMRRKRIRGSELHAKMHPFGELVIEEHSIFEYSRKNPPAHLIAALKKTLGDA